jgi:hypothetical protein
MLALDGQALAALGAASVDHGTATLGLHANQETVGTGAADFGRLVSTFHVGSLRRFSICVGKAPCLRPTIQVLRRTLSPPSRAFFHMQNMHHGITVNQRSKALAACQGTLRVRTIIRRPGHITLNTFRETRDYHSVGALMQ